MYYKKFIIAFLGVVRAAPHGSGPSVDAAIGIPGAFEVPVEWEHEAFMDGPLPTLNGTVQDVYRRLLEMNADYDAHLHLDALNIRRTELGARVDFSNARVYCDRKTFGSASVDGLSQGIDHLRGLGGRARSGGGPGACGRVSCSYGTGIWWCNDVSVSKHPRFCCCWHDEFCTEPFFFFSRKMPRLLKAGVQLLMERRRSGPVVRVASMTDSMPAK